MLSPINAVKKHHLVIATIVLNIFLYVGFTIVMVDRFESVIYGFQIELKERLLNLAKFNKQKASALTSKFANSDVNTDIKPHVKLEYYKVFDEFGFNRTQKSKLNNNRSMMGLGLPTDEVIQDLKSINIINNFFVDKPITVNEGFVSYTNRYIYIYPTVNITDYSLPKDYFTNARYAHDRLNEKIYNGTNNGIYFTEPYLDTLTSKKIFTIKSPVYLYDSIVGEYFTDIELYPFIIRHFGKSNFVYFSRINISIFSTDYNLSTPLFYNNNKSKFTLKPIVLDNNINLVASYSMYDIFNFIIEKYIFTLFLIISITLLSIYSCNVTLQLNKSLSCSLQDCLTGLYNRKVLSKRIDQQVKTAHNRRIPISIIMIDADKLKYINDTYGHEAGDHAIKHIAKYLKVRSRSTDTCIRLGGDEFCMVLFNTNRAQASELAERIYQAITSNPVVGLESPVSITTSTIQLKLHESLESAFRRADIKLYINKSSE
ncbi:GGDEF domain-containing protein [Vibrio kasasachensis]|uniref:GGDEF domain-containing protein n=1 Tax=Vibrio kasasachensis TaxID=2910248 RepID=UPI003D12FBE0